MGKSTIIVYARTTLYENWASLGNFKFSIP